MQTLSNQNLYRLSKALNFILFLLLFSGLAACVDSSRETPPVSAPAAGVLDANSAEPGAKPNAEPTTEPTIVDLWNGLAHFVVTATDTGLPMGESDTVIADESLYSYIHASHQSAGVLDQCGAPVAFPGCVVLLESDEISTPFRIISTADDSPACLFACASCPCDSLRDHIDQQQYPRVVRRREGSSERWWMVYEYRATIFLRRSNDGVAWSKAEEVPMTGIWQTWLLGCQQWELIGEHPFAGRSYDCLIGGPPGIYVDGETLYIFVGLGQNPGHMGCLYGPANGPAARMRKCENNPIFTGATEYGPEDVTDATTNPYFDFRTVSSADVIEVVERDFGKRYYMLYEGVRGSGPGDGGDTQFALGVARSQTNQIDGPWERFDGNPILIDQPGNVGVGHADILLVDGKTFLFTSLDGENRIRLELHWR